MTIRIVRLGIAACAVVVGALATQGAFDPNAATTFTMKSGDNNFCSSFTNKNWKAQSGVTPVAPQLMDDPFQDALPNPAAAGFDYYTAGYTLRTFKYDVSPTPLPTVITFGGRSLYVGTGGFQSGCQYYQFPLSVADLHFLENSSVKLNCAYGLTNSTITIDATTAKPMKILNTNGGGKNSFKFELFDCTLKGGSDARIVIAPNTASNGNGPVEVYYRGDGSDYLGRIDVDSTGYVDLATTLRLGRDTSLENATINVGRHGTLTKDGSAEVVVGMVNISTNGTLPNFTSGKVLVKNLTMTDGSISYDADRHFETERAMIRGGYVTIGQRATAVISDIDGSQGNIRLHYNYNLAEHRNGCVDVTNSFVGPVTLELDSEFIKDTLTNGCPAAALLTLPKSKGTLSVDDFTVSKPGTYGSLPEIELSIEDDAENGLWKLVLSPQTIVKLTKKTGTGDRWPTDGSFWSDGLPPHGDADYLDNAYLMYTYGTTCIFNMKSFTIVGQEIWLNSSRVEVTNFTLQGKASLVSSGGTTDIYAINGLRVPASTESPSATLRPYGGSATFVFRSPFVGEGDIQTLNRGSAKPGNVYVNYGGSTIKLMVDNPDFTGRIHMYKYAEGQKYPYTIAESTKLAIDTPGALGGPRSGFTYDALHIGYYGCLQPLRDMTLDDATRGIFIDWNGRFLVEDGITFNVNERLTMGGVCEKVGDGMLILGADHAPMFTKDQLADPPATGPATNVLNVTAGAFGVSTTNAADGLAIHFAAGTKLAVDINATDAVKTFGLYNRKGTVTFGGEALNVALADPGEDVGSVSVGVLTVPSAQASTFAGKLSARVRKCAVTFSAQADLVPGMTTFTATIARSGFMVLVR